MALIILQFGIQAATALSQSIVFVSSVLAAAQALLAPNPNDPGRSLVDVQAALLLCPPLLLGISTGIIANTSFPGWLTTLLYIPVLAAVAVRMLMVAKALWSQESRARQSLSQQFAELDAAAAKEAAMGQAAVDMEATEQNVRHSNQSTAPEPSHKRTISWGAEPADDIRNGSPLQGQSPARSGLPPPGIQSRRKSHTLLRNFSTVTTMRSAKPQLERTLPGTTKPRSLQRSITRSRTTLRGSSGVFSHTLQLLATGHCEAAHIDARSCVPVASSSDR